MKATPPNSQVNNLMTSHPNGINNTSTMAISKRIVKNFRTSPMDFEFFIVY